MASLDFRITLGTLLIFDNVGEINKLSDELFMKYIPFGFPDKEMLKKFNNDVGEMSYYTER